MGAGLKPKKEVKRKVLPKRMKPKCLPDPAESLDHKKAFEQLLDDAILGSKSTSFPQRPHDDSRHN